MEHQISQRVSIMSFSLDLKMEYLILKFVGSNGCIWLNSWNMKKTVHNKRMSAEASVILILKYLFNLRSTRPGVWQLILRNKLRKGNDSGNWKKRFDLSLCDQTLFLGSEAGRKLGEVPAADYAEEDCQSEAQEQEEDQKGRLDEYDLRRVRYCFLLLRRSLLLLFVEHMNLVKTISSSKTPQTEEINMHRQW